MINLIPTPTKCVVQNEQYHGISHTVCADIAKWQDGASAFCESVFKIYGVRVTVGAPGGVELRMDPTLAADAYALDSTAGAVVIRASSFEGACYGLATALQLIEVKNGVLSVQSVAIEDRPEKEYRAFMTDPQWTLQPFSKLLKYVDLCFFYKVKYLHLHLADSRHYCYPSRAFPRLNAPGEYYSFEQMAELNAYAAARGILLVPEFECPGHATPLTRVYPDVFANHTDREGGKFYNELGAEIDPSGLICAGSACSLEGVKKLIAELAELFPAAPYIHIGGDEAPYQMWEQCVDCRAYMEKNGIQSARDLYGEYVGRVASFVLSLGKVPMVWEGFSSESSHYIPKETVVIAWESHYQTAPELLRNGFRIINASWQPLYFVTSQKRRWNAQDILNWDVYNWQHWWEHSVATLNPIHVAPTEKVLGATLCAWGMEYEQLITRLLENMPAFAERTWSMERHYDFDTYRHIAEPLCDKAATLIRE